MRRIKRSSANSGLSLDLFLVMSSPDLLNRHSDGTEEAVIQNNIFAILAMFGSCCRFDL